MSGRHEKRRIAAWPLDRGYSGDVTTWEAGPIGGAMVTVMILMVEKAMARGEG